MASESRRTVLAAFGANLAIAAAKTVAGVIGGSTAMLAEAAHSFADSMNQVFLLVSLQLGDRPPDEDHPFGHGKERFFWAFLAAVFIFVSGAVFSLMEGARALLGGHAVEVGYPLTYGVLVFSLVAEGYSLYRAVRQVRGEAAADGTPLWPYVRQSKDPTIRTVLFEDSAAVIGVLLAVIAFVLGRDAKGLLIGEAAGPEHRAAIRRTILAHPGVEDVPDLRTMHIGPESLLVAARVNLHDGIPSQKVEELSGQIERDLRRAVPEVTEVFLDPTHRRAAAS